MAKVVYDRSGSYRRDSRGSSYRSHSETNSYDAQYETKRTYDTEFEEVYLNQPSRRDPASIETDSVQTDPSRVRVGLERSHSESKSYDARYEANRVYDTEKAHLMQPSRRGPASFETDSIQTDPSRVRVGLERSHSESKSYDARYEANRVYDTEKAHLMQPGRRGPASFETDSAQTDPSRIPVGLDKIDSKANSYDVQYEVKTTYDTEEVFSIQPGRRGPASFDADHDSVQTDPSRVPTGLDRSHSEAYSYDARGYEPNRTYNAEEVHLIQPGRRGPASLETDSVQTDPSRVVMDLDKGHREAYSYGARYKATNIAYDGEKAHLIQPGRLGTASLETDSVQTDVSRIPMGLDVFLNVDQFVIQQNYQSEAWWDSVRFEVKDGRGKQIVEVRQEKADNSCVQAILGKMRQYFMKVYVKSNEWIMEFEHPWSCLTPIFCPWASPSMIVRMPTGEVLGQVKNASRETCGNCLPPTKYFEVLDYEETIINAVTGPTCYPFECSRSNPATFELLKVEKSGKTMQVGDITHQWRGFCGGVASCCFTEDKETVTVTFPKECPVEDKALFLSLGFLVLFTFFEVK